MRFRQSRRILREEARGVEGVGFRAPDGFVAVQAVVVYPEEHSGDGGEVGAGLGVAEDEVVVWSAEAGGCWEEAQGFFEGGVGVFELVDDVRVVSDQFCCSGWWAEDFVVLLS